MTNLSAMRWVQYLNPQVLSSALGLELTKVEEGQSYVMVLVTFVLTHLGYGFLGFVAFVIKLTHLVARLQALSVNNYSSWILLQEIGLLYGFVNQVFGITQIWQVETRQLFSFIFGGQDSKMQAGELDRQKAFLASATQFVCQRLYQDDPKRKLYRAIAMLSFTHQDIQSLVLDEDESQEVDARTSFRMLNVRP